LATIATTAPWIGIFGTVLGLCNFKGFDGNPEDGLAYVALAVSEAVVPCAAGLILALLATWFHKYLLAESETFDSEM
jgi:biopolymer transport protein ExbB/TolQ